ncbi:putative TBC1 domain family member 5 [Blattamonas nauphoetae]|uniref:TBC1 domain family member 5 n=1 Tax=Blattamonas nauphoetae TaxID=2049346 RepID=A0ABQ9XTI1_9EUKA|nr:putative TBC1 domain family member 5 [Blattamonas nauphoetae]
MIKIKDRRLFPKLNPHEQVLIEFNQLFWNSSRPIGVCAREQAVSEGFDRWLIRPICWLHFLGVLRGPPSENWVQQLKESRAIFEEKYQQYIVDPHKEQEHDPTTDNPLSTEESSNWGQFFVNKGVEDTILQDLNRLFPDKPFFQAKETIEALRMILLIWVRDHPQAGYCQGMHEIVAVLFYVYSQFTFEAAVTSVDPKDEAQVNLAKQEELLALIADKRYVVHDVWSSFANLVPHITRWYYEEKRQEPTAETRSRQRRQPRKEEAPKGIAEDEVMAKAKDKAGTTEEDTTPSVIVASRRISTMLARVNRPYFDLLQHSGIEFHYFMMKWMRIMFVREFPFSEVIRVWDAIFAVGDDGTFSSWMGNRFKTEEPQNQEVSSGWLSPSSDLKLLDWMCVSVMESVQSRITSMLQDQEEDDPATIQMTILRELMHIHVSGRSNQLIKKSWEHAVGGPAQFSKGKSFPESVKREGVDIMPVGNAHSSLQTQLDSAVPEREPLWDRMMEMSGDVGVDVRDSVVNEIEKGLNDEWCRQMECAQRLQNLRWLMATFLSQQDPSSNVDAGAFDAENEEMQAIRSELKLAPETSLTDMFSFLISQLSDVERTLRGHSSHLTPLPQPSAGVETNVALSPSELVSHLSGSELMCISEKESVEREDRIVMNGVATLTGTVFTPAEMRQKREMKDTQQFERELRDEKTRFLKQRRDTRVMSPQPRGSPVPPQPSPSPPPQGREKSKIGAFFSRLLDGLEQVGEEERRPEFKGASGSVSSPLPPPSQVESQEEKRKRAEDEREWEAVEAKKRAARVRVTEEIERKSNKPLRRQDYNEIMKEEIARQEQHRKEEEERKRMKEREEKISDQRAIEQMLKQAPRSKVVEGLHDVIEKEEEAARKEEARREAARGKKDTKGSTQITFPKPIDPSHERKEIDWDSAGTASAVEYLHPSETGLLGRGDGGKGKGGKVSLFGDADEDETLLMKIAEKAQPAAKGRPSEGTDEGATSVENGPDPLSNE